MIAERDASGGFISHARNLEELVLFRAPRGVASCYVDVGVQDPTDRLGDLVQPPRYHRQPAHGGFNAFPQFVWNNGQLRLDTSIHSFRSRMRRTRRLVSG